MLTPQLHFNYPNRFDRLLFVVSAHYVTVLQSDRFVEKINNDGFLFREFKDTNSVFGLNALKWEPSKGRFWIEIGAKLLGQRYSELLHRGNIYDALDILNSKGIIQIDPRALRQAGISSLAITDDKYLETPYDELLKSIAMLAVPAGRYKLIPYSKGDKLKTLHFQRQVTTKVRKHLLKIYDKAHEFLLPCNASFRASVPNAGLIAAQFKHMKRFELEAKSEHKIRELFKLPSHTYCSDGGKPKPRRPYLLEVLESQETPLLNIWKEITAEMQQLKPLTITNSNTEVLPDSNAFCLFLLQLEPEKQKDFGLMMATHLDMDKLKYLTKHSYPRPQTVSYRMQRYRELLRQWYLFKDDMLRQTLGLVNQVTNQLATHGT